MHIISEISVHVSFHLGFEYDAKEVPILPR